MTELSLLQQQIKYLIIVNKYPLNLNFNANTLLVERNFNREDLIKIINPKNKKIDGIDYNKIYDSIQYFIERKSVIIYAEETKMQLNYINKEIEIFPIFKYKKLSIFEKIKFSLNKIIKYFNSVFENGTSIKLGTDRNILNLIKQQEKIQIKLLKKQFKQELKQEIYKQKELNNKIIKEKKEKIEHNLEQIEKEKYII